MIGYMQESSKSLFEYGLDIVLYISYGMFFYMHIRGFVITFVPRACDV